MKLNLKRWYSKLYRSAYGIQTQKRRTPSLWDLETQEDYVLMPDNICSFFWPLLLAIITFIPALPGHMWNIIARKYHIIAIWWAIHLPIFMALGLLKFNAKTIDNASLWEIYCFGAFYSLLVSLAIAIFFGLCYFEEEKYKPWRAERRAKRNKSKIIKERRVNPLLEGFKAFKGKYCTKLEWIK